MSSGTPRMPWGVWLRIHGKAICQALPLSFLIVVESRDLYYRATWAVEPVPPQRFETGDVIALCNRWYTLPAWGQVLYSLLSKALLKSCWEDVAVVSRSEGGRPQVLFCDFDGAHEMPLDEFLQTRLPRGAALRKLRRDAATTPPPSDEVARLFSSEVQKLKPRPWYLFSASMRGGAEHKYYEFCVGMNAQRRRIREMLDRRQSRQAIAAQQQKLRDMEVMRKHFAEFVTRDETYHLFNGSLVASFLAVFGLLERDLPPLSRYVPQDFAHDLPCTGATYYDEPVIFFKH